MTTTSPKPPAPARWLYIGKTISRLNNVYAILDPFPDFTDKTWLVEESAYLALQQERDACEERERYMTREWESACERIKYREEERDAFKAENARLKFRCENSAWEHQRTIELLRGRNVEVEQIRARLEKMRAALITISKEPDQGEHYSAVDLRDVAKEALRAETDDEGVDR